MKLIGVLAVSALLAQPAITSAQTAGQSLGSVNVSRAVKANGEALPAGTYTLRLIPEDLSKVVGQTPSESRWVEFVKGGKVVAKEVATVLTGTEVKAVVDGAAPAAGTSKTQMLKGNDYLRIWINRGGTHYLVHLTVPKA
jgi:hypothetical protein